MPHSDSWRWRQLSAAFATDRRVPPNGLGETTAWVDLSDWVVVSRMAGIGVTQTLTTRPASLANHCRFIIGAIADTRRGLLQAQKPERYQQTGAEQNKCDGAY